MNISLPARTKRVILLSNIANPPAFQFADGDLVVELNRAVHHEALRKVIAGHPIDNFLVVRHNKDKHFLPENFAEISTSWDTIVLSSNRYGFNQEAWFRKYVKDSKKYPTTGYCAYKAIRERRPKIEIIGLGFNLDDHSTPHAAMHDWEREHAEFAKDKHFTFVK